MIKTSLPYGVTLLAFTTSLHVSSGFSFIHQPSTINTRFQNDRLAGRHLSTSVSFIKQQQQYPSNTILSLSSSTNKNSLDDQTPNVMERLQLTSQFERWVFLQKLLDVDLSAPDINELLYLVLQSWVEYPRSERNNIDRGSPELEDDKLKVLKDVVHKYSSIGNIPIISMSMSTSMDSAKSDKEEISSVNKLMNDLESLLPDMYEDPDAYEGLWDILKELHGEESVSNRQNVFFSADEEDYDWDKLALVARVLIHFDFLTKGIEVKPSV